MDGYKFLQLLIQHAHTLLVIKIIATWYLLKYSMHQIILEYAKWIFQRIKIAVKD